MTWIRNNKFLAGFFGFMLVGILGLGYLLYSAYTSYADVSETYDKESAELVRLQSLVPYPDNQSLQKYQEQKAVYVKNAENLQTVLDTWNKKLQPITPQAFQEELKEAAADYMTAAAQNGVHPPDDFYMGFPEYRDSPPNPDAASPLDRELKGAEVILKELVDSRVTSIVSFSRPKQLPEELGPVDTTAAAASPAVTYFPFDLKFTSGQGQFRRFMNALVHNKEQFFIIRTVSVANSIGKAPHRAPDAAADAGNLPDGPVEPMTLPNGKVYIQFVLGKENVTVSMRIEIVEFAAPATGTAGN